MGDDKSKKKSDRTHIEFPRNATPAQMLRAIKRVAHELRPDLNPPVEDEAEQDSDETEAEDGEEKG